MNIRVMAGLGMLLVAGGLMVMWFLGGREGSPNGPVDTAPQAQRPHALPGLENRTGPAAVDSFLTVYNADYAALAGAAATAAWEAATAPDGSAGIRRLTAQRALGDFTGSRENIARLRLLKGRRDLSDLQARQVDRAWQRAAVRPGTWPDLSARILALESALRDSVAQRSAAGFPPRDGGDRRSAWELDRRAARTLRDPLADLRDLRNRAAREMGYTSWFGLQAASHGLTTPELAALLQDIVDQVMPLYRQLHCWTRHRLAADRGVPAPRLLPVHWLDDPDGAIWRGVTDAPAPRDIQGAWMVDQASAFWESLGLESLAPGAVAEGGAVVVPTVWSLDSGADVRGLLGPLAGRPGLATAHGSLGLAHAHRATAQPGIPPLLRGPTDGLMAHTVMSLGALQTRQPPYLDRLGWPAAEAPEQVQRLLHEALTGPVASLPFLLGTLAGWEHDFYENVLPVHRFTPRWWELAETWQGLAPPAPRGEEDADPMAVTAVVTEPAAGWQRALGMVAAHQLHRYVCASLLGQEVRAADWYGSREAGLLLHDMMALGGTRDGLVVLAQATGEDLSVDALLEYYAPLQDWLESQNEGRDVNF